MGQQSGATADGNDIETTDEAKSEEQKESEHKVDALSAAVRAMQAHSHHGLGHHHHGDGHDHGHDHDDGDDEMKFGTSLLQYIDRRNIKCLNESEANSGKKVFKEYDDRLDSTISVESNIDGELLFTVYFTVEVQLRSVQLTMGSADSAPTVMKLWNDKADKIDFDNHTEVKCSQEFELCYDPQCELSWKTKQHKFSDVTVLKMLFQNDNYENDEEEIVLNCILLKGNYKGPKSRRAVHAIYEAAANPNDHAMIQKAKQDNASKNDSV